MYHLFLQASWELPQYSLLYIWRAMIWFIIHDEAGSND